MNFDFSKVWLPHCNCLLQVAFLHCYPQEQGYKVLGEDMYLPSQVEVTVVCKVHWSCLSCRRTIVDLQIIFIGQRICDAGIYLTRVSLLTVHTFVRENYLVIHNFTLPVDLINEQKTKKC